MLVPKLAQGGQESKTRLTYAMLYSMFEKINSDLGGVLQHEKEQLSGLFRTCEEQGITPEKAVLKNNARITSYTTSALFHAQRLGISD